MRLVENWKEISLRAHSMWAFYLSFIALFMADIIYVATGRDTDPRMWIYISAAFLLYGIAGRLFAQGIEGDERSNVNMWLRIFLIGSLALALAACERQEAAQKQSDANQTPSVAHSAPAQPQAEAFNALALSFIAKWEGLRLAAYKDIVGVWTVCYGETKGVKRGDVYTKAECDAMLEREIADYRSRLRPAFTASTIAARLPPPREVAYVSLAYNVGVAGAAKSTAVRRLNASDVEGGCEALGWWNKAGGRVVRGLVRRRAEEIELCLKDSLA